MAKFHQVVEKKNGWSDWEAPIQKGYKMACCDCGLVHDIDFRIVKVTKTKKGGYFDFEDLPTGINKGKYRALLRARRNKRSTAAMRRGKKYK